MSRLISQRLPLTTNTKLFTRHLTTSIRRKMPLIAGTGKPRVILGTMTFGPDEKTGARILDLDTYKSCLDYFQVQLPPKPAYTSC